jgi:hypothetical protein
MSVVRMFMFPRAISDNEWPPRPHVESRKGRWNENCRLRLDVQDAALKPCAAACAGLAGRTQRESAEDRAQWSDLLLHRVKMARSLTICEGVTRSSACNRPRLCRADRTPIRGASTGRIGEIASGSGASPRLPWRMAEIVFIHPHDPCQASPVTGPCAEPTFDGDQHSNRPRPA